MKFPHLPLLLAWLCLAAYQPLFGNETTSLEKKLSFLLFNQDKEQDGWYTRSNTNHSRVYRDDNAETPTLCFTSDGEEMDYTNWAFTDLPLSASGAEVEFSFDYSFTGSVGTGLNRITLIAYESNVEKFTEAPDGFQLSEPSDGWQSVAIHLPINETSQRIRMLINFSGEGQLSLAKPKLRIRNEDNTWIDLFEVEKQAFLAIPANRDTELNTASQVTIGELNDFQWQSLEALGQLWAFLKYYHPSIAAGEFNWDAELFRIIPQTLAADSPDQRSKVFMSWIQMLNQRIPDQYDRAVSNPEADIQTPADLRLLERVDWYSPELITALNAIHEIRPVASHSHYLETNYAGGGNPINELPFDQSHYPDDGVRLLGVYRTWAYIQYLSPNRAITDKDWASVLLPSIQEAVQARNEGEYYTALRHLIVEICDGHSSIGPRPDSLKLTWTFPVKLCYVENQYVVSDYFQCEHEYETPFKMGDVILEIDGNTIEQLNEKYWDITPGSNDLARKTNLGGYLFHAPEQAGTATILRDGKRLNVSFDRMDRTEFTNTDKHLLALQEQEPFYPLEDGLLYLNVQSFKSDHISALSNELATAKGLVIDLRTYPKSAFSYQLGAYLIGNKPYFTPTTSDYNNLGQFNWRSPVSCTPEESSGNFSGKIAILVNEDSVSHAEFSAMIHRQHPNAKIFGRQTAGADGDVNSFDIPGGFQSRYSSIGVFYPDKTPTQRIGIIPDVEVQPTIEGIREGRDEILEAALAYLREE